MPGFTPGRRFQPPYYPFSRRPLWERALAMLERRVKGAMFGCRMCGNCLLQETAFICPMECPKGLRNGPCGGSTPEGCYVDPTRPCIWHRIYERAEQRRTTEKLLEVLPPLDWSRVGHETWAEVFLEARAKGLGPALTSLISSSEQRRAFWAPIFKQIRQPLWWGGDDKPHSPAPHKPASTLEQKLAAGQFVVTSEVAPPLSVAPDELTRTLNILRDYIDAANFTDNPSATPRMSSLACSTLALQQGVEPVMQIAARDRTRMGLQAEVLGAAALGIRNILCLTGDHSRMGPAPHGRMDIWDIDSIQMLWILRRMRDAKTWLDGRTIANPPKLFLGAAASPCASTPRIQAQRELKKSQAGAQFFQSNLVYDVEAFERYLEALDKVGALAHSPFLVGITPIRSARAARIMTQVPGVKIPEALIARLEKSSNPQEEGFQIALEIIDRTRKMQGVRGVHIMAVGWELIVPRMVREASLKDLPARAKEPQAITVRTRRHSAAGNAAADPRGAGLPPTPDARNTEASADRRSLGEGGQARVPKDFTDRSYLDALAHRVLVFDGALGTEIQKFNLTAADFGGERYAGCNDYLVLQKPEVIEKVHASYLEAGADVIETCTFRSNRITMQEYGLEDRIVEINRAAAALARRVADGFTAGLKARATTDSSTVGRAFRPASGSGATTASSPVGRAFRPASGSGATTASSPVGRAFRPATAPSASRPVFVAGSIGPTGKLPSSSDPELSKISFGELADVFSQQAEALMEGDVDLLLIETSQDMLEVKAAIMGVQDAFARTGRKIPLQVQVTLDPNGRMLLGTDVSAVLTTLERMPVDVIGINCSTGPEHMRAPLAYLGEHSSKFVSCLPNAGLPQNINGQAVYPLSPDDYAREMLYFVDTYNLNAAGGCCGTTPAHINAFVTALASPERVDVSGRAVARPGEASMGEGGRAQSRSHVVPLPLVSSGMTTAGLTQTPPPMLIGERLNAQGSKKMKELLLAEDYDGIAALGREQIDGGAHTLDICVAMTERRDEAYLMSQVVKKLSQTVEAPLVIDTTEAEVLEVALEASPGRVIVNAVNMENGRQRLDAMLPLVRDYGAATIALTIDEHGMARTADRKVEIARKIYDIATGEFGLRPDALIFDALTFTLATGDPESANTAAETIEGIKRIKAELPGVLTSLGVSNVSYGFKPAARWVLNSVFLYHCVQAGLDMAIVNPKQVTPYADIPEAQRELAEDLLFNRRSDATARFIAFFEGAKQRQASAVDPMSTMTPTERLQWRILHRQPEGGEADIDAVMAEGVREITGIANFAMQPGYTYPNVDTSQVAVRVLNQVLLPAMKEVGDKFGTGELILPFVLQSAEAMKRAVTHLERYLEKSEGVSKGRVVLATVYGDVHDIGKNLIKTILANNGYDVHDLGKQVPVNTIVDRAVELKADVIGLSALLVSTSRQMPLVVRELDRRGLAIPVLIGGAAINREFGLDIARIDERPYSGGVFYCRDAFEGLETVDKLVDPNARKDLLEAERTALRGQHGPASVSESASAPTVASMPESASTSGFASAAESTSAPAAVIVRAADVPTPPFWGARALTSLPLDDVFAHLNEARLFKSTWGGKAATARADSEAARAATDVARASTVARAATDVAPASTVARAATDVARASTVARVFRPARPASDPDFQSRLATMKQAAPTWLSPAAVYGYFPAQSDGNQVVVFDPNDFARELTRFSFPRQQDGERLCLADYFLPIGSEKMDVLAIQVVTVGPGATARFDAMDANNEYSEAFYLHGLAVQSAEAATELVHERMCAELGLPEGRGVRFAWGYGALPDVEEHRKVFALLPAERDLGMSLTNAGQLIPEQSTATMMVHCPGAHYFKA